MMVLNCFLEIPGSELNYGVHASILTDNWSEDAILSLAAR